MSNLLQFLAGLLIAVLVAILAGPYFIDWNQYKTEIETQASRLIGRPLSIAGDVQLGLLPAPYLRLDNIRISAAPASGGKVQSDLLTAKAFKLWLSGPPLLRGAIEVEQIELIEPVMNVTIDERGASNWSRGTAEPREPIPFVPTNVSLQLMKIIDGAVHLAATGLKDRHLELLSINGNLSAGSLSGPFKFEGGIGEETGRLSLALATGRVDDKGELRLKALMRSAATGERYSFDGSLLDLETTPGIKGLLSASFPFLELAGDADKPRQIEPVEIKTAVNADARQAAFEQILVTLVHRNRPQMMTGSGHLDWNGGKILLDGKLESRLLDLDHLKDGLQVGGGSVVETIGALFDRIRAAAALIDGGHFLLDMKQVKLNGDLIQDIDFLLARDDEGLQIERLAANLPGDNRLHIGGRFIGPAASTIFQGAAILRGQNLGGLVTWAADADLGETNGPIRVRPFTLRGDIELGNRQWALRNAFGDIADTAFSGEIGLTKAADERPGELSVKLTAGEIDTAALVGRAVAMREILDLALQGRGGDAGRDRAGSALGRLIADKVVNLELRSGRLRLADLDGQDLIAELYYGLNRLDIRELSVRSSDGLRLRANGAIDDLEHTPAGALTTDIDIADSAELGHFISWFRTSEAPALSGKQLAALSPLRLAVMLQTDPERRSAALIRVNGTAGSSHIGFTNRVIGSNLFSRREPLKIEQLEVTGTVTSDSGRLLLSQLVPYLPLDEERLSALGAGKLWLSAAGLPEQGLSSRLEFTSKRVSAGFDGRLGWQQGISRVQGKLHLETGDTASGFALLGINLPAAKETGALALRAELDKKDGIYEFSHIDGTIASSEVQGHAKLTTAEAAKKLDLVLLASSLDMPALFTPLIEGATVSAGNGNVVDLRAAEQMRSAVESTIASDAAAFSTIATNRHFDPRLLDGVSAEVLITADRLGLGDGIALSNGELSATLDGRNLTVTNIGGELWGGQLMAKGRLDLRPAIAELSGSLNVTRAVLDKAPFKTEGTPLAAGQLDLAAEFNGKGISPAGLLSFLNGKGQFSIKHGKLNRFNPAVLDEIVEDELAIWDKQEDETPFLKRFERHLVNADMPIADMTLPFKIADGVLDFSASQEITGHSKLDMNLNLALAPMNLRARFSLTPLKEAHFPDLPAAAVIYEGSLASDSGIAPRIEASSLEQHLKVMKMEHDVELLEKLHRQDEEISRKAAEKREQERIDAEQAVINGTAAGMGTDANADVNGAGVSAPTTAAEAPANGAEKPLATPTTPKPNWNPFSESFNGVR